MSRMTGIAALAVWGFALSGWGASETILDESFDSPSALAHWQGGPAELDAHGSGQCLRMSNADPDGSTMLRLALPTASLVGRFITLRASVKAENVSEPPNRWNGVKAMLAIATPEGAAHPQADIPLGSFDWIRVEKALRIPKSARQIDLALGLERSTGTVWFDDLEIRLGRPGAGMRLDEPFKGHGLSRLRGVMHGPEFGEEKLRVLAEDWGANQVRWQLNWTPMKQAEEWAQNLEEYDRWLAGALESTDKAVEACERLGLMMLLDLHCPPGGRAEGGLCRMFTEKRYQEKFLQVWDMIARRYKGRGIIYAYDLINEPVEPSRPIAGLLNWPNLAEKAAEAIRAIDPGKPVVFEPGPWGGCEGFDKMVPLALDNVIYSFHMYKPHSLTHQGIQGIPSGTAYPGVIEGERWDKERLREAMAPAIDFQREFNAHIYVGEFSCIRWAPPPSAFNYLRDAIDLFEEYGWDWSYHSYYGFNGWSVEHGADPNDNQPAEQPTDRKELLLQWFEKNERP